MDRKFQTLTIRDLCSKLVNEKPDLDTLTATDNPSLNGLSFEHVSQLLVSTKDVGDYDKLYYYDSTLKRDNVTDKWIKCESFSQLLDKPIYTGGDGGLIL